MDDQYPRKYLLKDLVNEAPPKNVWIQGTIEQAVGDVLIMSDGTGRAKVTKCENADGLIDRTCLRKGTYCCVIGTAVKTRGLPEVHTTKFVDLSKQIYMKMTWEAEVKETNFYLSGHIIPSI